MQRRVGTVGTWSWTWRALVARLVTVGTAMSLPCQNLIEAYEVLLQREFPNECLT